MAQNLSLGVLIGGAVSPAFKSSMKQVKTSMEDMGKSIKSLSSTKANIQAFDKAKIQAVALGSSVKDLSGKVINLKSQLASGNNSPQLTQQLQTELKKTTQQLDITKNKFKEQMNVVRENRTAMEAAGIGVATYKQSLGSLNAELEKAEKKQASFNELVSRRDAAGAQFKSSLGSFAKTVAVGAAVTVPLKMLESKAADYDYTMQLIGNSANLTQTEIKALGKHIMDLGPKTGQSVEKIQASMTDLIDSGFGIEGSIKLAEIYGKTATATGMSIEQLNNAGYQMIDTLGLRQENIGVGLEILTQTAKDGRFSLEALLESVPKLTDRLHKLNMTGTTGTAEMGAMFQVAMKGAGDRKKAGIQVESFFDKFLTPDMMGKVEKTLGVNVQSIIAEAEAAGKSAFEPVLKAIVEASNGNTQVFGELSKNKNIRDFLTSMTKNWGEYEDIKKSALNSSGVIDTDLEKMRATSKQQKEEILHEFNSLKIAIGQTFSSSFGQAAASIRPVIIRIREFVQANPKLIGTIAKVAVVGATLATTLAGIGVTIAALKFGALSLMTTGVGMVNAIGKVGSAFKMLSAIPGGPILMTIAAIATIGFAIYQNWETIGPMLSGVWTSITETFTGVWTKIKSFFSWVWEGIKTAFFSFTPLGIIISKWEPISNFFIGLWDRVKAPFVTVWGFITENILGFDPISPLLEKWAGISDFFKGVFDGIKNALSFGSSSIEASPSVTVKPVEKPTTAALSPSTVTPVTTSASLPAAAPVISPAPTVSTTPTVSTAQIVSPDQIAVTVAPPPINEIKANWSPVTQTIDDIGLQTSDAFKTHWEAMGQTIASYNPIEIISPIWAPLAQSFFDIGSQIVDGLISGMNAKLEALRQTAATIAKTAEGSVKQTAQIHSPSRVFAEMGSQMVEGLRVGVVEKGRNFYEALNDLIDVNNQPEFAFADGQSLSSFLDSVELPAPARRSADSENATASNSATVNQTFNITINQLPGQDNQQLVDQIMREIESKQKLAARSALGDWA